MLARTGMNALELRVEEPKVGAENQGKPRACFPFRGGDVPLFSWRTPTSLPVSRDCHHLLISSCRLFAVLKFYSRSTSGPGVESPSLPAFHSASKSGRELVPSSLPFRISLCCGI